VNHDHIVGPAVLQSLGDLRLATTGTTRQTKNRNIEKCHPASIAHAGPKEFHVFEKKSINTTKNSPKKKNSIH
jgi:hypothetical protein